MGRHRLIIGISALTLILGSCSFTEDSLLPSLTGDEPSKSEEKVPVAASEAEANPQPTVSGSGSDSAGAQQTQATAPVKKVQTTQVQSSGSAAGAETGTAVGKKVQQQRSTLEALRGSVGQRQQAYEQLRETIRQNSQSYFATVAAITARLRIGTTPGNPVLISQWNAAQAELDRLATGVDSMGALGNQVAADSATANFLIDEVRATYLLQGAVDEDHRQLQEVEDETSRVIVLIDRLLMETQQTVNRYTSYIGSERKNLESLSLAIKAGEYFGPSLGAAGGSVAPPIPDVETLVRAADQVGKKRPLVVIRFENDNVEYRQALYQAVSTALERRPESRFDVVAVAPSAGASTEVALETNNSMRNAERVRQSLIEMGMPAYRTTLSSASSSAAQMGEVHVYVR